MTTTTNENKKTGKQSFDRTPYIRTLVWEKGRLAVQLGDGTHRNISSDDVAGLNNALLPKFNSAGSEEGARRYAEAIDSGVWPVTVTSSGDMAQWVTDFSEWLQGLGLDLTPYIVNETDSTGNRTRVWQISTPEQGFFDDEMEDGIEKYMLANNIKSTVKNRAPMEFGKFKIRVVTEWAVQISTPRKEK